MRISDWSSDVCSSDLIFLDVIMFAEQEDRHLPEVAPNKFILVGFGDEPSHSLTEESAERFCRQTGWIGNVRRGGGVGMEADPDLAVEMLARVEMSRFALVPQRKSGRRRVGKECAR